MNKTKGFTLAEVLITLAVIGVVAAITIPSLLYSFDEKQLITKWKKGFSSASTALKRIYTDDANNKIDFTDSTTMKNDFKAVLHEINEGNFNALTVSSYRYYESSSTMSTSTDPAANMLDGNLWAFTSLSSDCSTTVGSLNNLCGKIYIDVNGSKAPNMIGKDLYGLWIVKLNSDYNAFPMGSNDDGKSCVNPATSEDESWGCSANALYKEIGSIPD